MSYVQERTTKSVLAERFQGALIESGDDRYDSSRAVWNAAVNRKPALIAQCADAVDVIAALEYARSNSLAVSVRAGGHNVTGAAIADGGVVIDLSQMKGIEIDPERRVARAEPGLTWNEYQAAVGEFGLATPSGKISTTGVGGLALGGGIGWLVRKYGMTIDNLLSAQIVTADGRLLTASSVENPDLFWAIRGGGGNFGIAVSFEFRLHDVPTVYGGLIGYPLSKAEEVLKFYRSFIADAPDELTSVAVLVTGPDGNKMVGIAVCYAGPVDEGELTIKPLLDFTPPVMVQVGAMPYSVLSSMVDPMAPAGVKRAWRSSFFSEMSDDAISTIVDIFKTGPTAHCVGLDRTLRRRDGPDRSERDRVLAPQQPDQSRDRRWLARPGGGVCRARLAASHVGPRAATCHRLDLRRFPRSRRTGARQSRLWRSELRPPGADQSDLRPDQCVQQQSEHRAEQRNPVTDAGASPRARGTVFRTNRSSWSRLAR